MQHLLNVSKITAFLACVFTFMLGGVVFAWPNRNWLYWLIIAILAILISLCGLYSIAAYNTIEGKLGGWYGRKR